MPLGLSLGLGLTSTGGVRGYDAASLAIFSAFSTPPDTTRKGLIDTAVKALKAAGVWTLLDFLQVYAAADSQAALINWINPGTFNASLVAAPTFTADRGFTFNGTTNYVDTGFDPTTAAGKFAQDSGYFGAWSLTSGQITNPFAGFWNGTNGTFRRSRDATNNVNGRVNQGANLATVDGLQTDGTGLHGSSRSASNALRLARNGANVVTGSTASVAMAAGNFRVGSISASLFAAVQAALCMAGQNLTQPQELAAYTALLAYMSAVGAVSGLGSPIGLLLSLTKAA